MNLYHLTKYEVNRLRNAEIRMILSCQPRGRIVAIVAIDTWHGIGVIWISSLSSFLTAPEMRHM